jgi:hypothetical protein
MAGKIKFETNIPVSLTLLSLEAETAPSNFGGDQLKFSTREGPFWVSEAVGSILLDQIRKKSITTASPVEICRREIAQTNGRKGIHWLIDQLGFAPGEQRDGTFVVPKQNGANGSKPPAPPAATPQQQPPVSIVPDSHNGSANGNGSNGHAASPALIHSGWAGSIREQTQTLIDLYADLCKYASERHSGVVTKDDVRALLMNRLIGGEKNGGAR